MTNNSKKPAIIFLNPPYNETTNLLTSDISKFCKNNNLKVIKIIHARGIYDTSSLHKLMHRIRSCGRKPVTIIINKSLKSPVNVIQCAVLETLITLDIVKILTFEKGKNELKFEFLGKYESNLLHAGSVYSRNIAAPSKSNT